MSLGCEKRDKDLLFVQHGMLSWFRAYLTGLHVKRCAACASRTQDLANASRALGLANGARSFAPMPVRVPRLALVALAALLLASIGFGAYALFLSPKADPAPAETLPAPEHCEFPEDTRPLAGTRV